MRKKQANMYFIPSSLSSPPYLHPQQLSQFQSEYTLFDEVLDLKKLKESFAIFSTTAPPHENYKPVEKFINKIQSKKGCGFQEYLEQMKEFFQLQNQGELLLELIGEGKMEIKGKVVQEILEEIMGREVSDNELSSIMQKIFDIHNPNQPITKQQIQTLFSNSRN